jgi:hypothetical protein
MISILTLIVIIKIKIMVITDGNLEVKLPTIWTDEKTEVGRVREEKRKKHQRRKNIGRKKCTRTKR